jgi:hypothetical protein
MMKEVAVREPPARIAGVEARAPWFFHAKSGGNSVIARSEMTKHPEGRMDCRGVVLLAMTEGLRTATHPSLLIALDTQREFRKC